ncbi:Small subunit processome component 20-like protein, partial [Armadillidium vulgare]
MRRVFLDCNFKEMDMIQILIRDNSDNKPEANHSVLPFRLNNKEAIRWHYNCHSKIKINKQI